MLKTATSASPALGASIASDRGAAASRRLLLLHVGCAVAGVATALALVSLLTLVRAGALPQLGRLTSYARLYAIGGFAQMQQDTN